MFLFHLHIGHILLQMGRLGFFFFFFFPRLEEIRAVSPLALLCTNMTFDDICLEIHRLVGQFHIWTLQYLQSCLLFAHLYRDVLAAAAAALTASASLSPLIFFFFKICWCMSFYLVTGAKVSWLPLLLSSAVQKRKWTCSESTLKNYFSLSRR